MIKRAGENVAAAEVEAVVNEHPSVFESAAVGAPDEMRDEMIVVYVVLNEGAAYDEKALTEWCQERLSKFRVPSRFTEAEGAPAHQRRQDPQEPAARRAQRRRHPLATATCGRLLPPTARFWRYRGKNARRWPGSALLEDELGLGRLGDQLPARAHLGLDDDRRTAGVQRGSGRHDDAFCELRR